MSYTGYTGEPEQAKLYGTFTFTCVCPRCGGEIVIHNPDFVNGFEAECNNPRCRKPDERAGYILMFYPHWSHSQLGLSDRPLHKELDK